MKKFALVTFVTLFAFATTMIAADTAKPNAVEVEILIFSGRPNPVFTVTNPGEVQSLVAAVKSLTVAPVDTSSITRGGLGYRGIAVRHLADTEISSFLVRHSTVLVNTGLGGVAMAQGRADAGRALEAQLLALAQSHGALDASLAAHIQGAK